MFLLFNAAQPYVYVIIGATVVVFAIVVIVFARLQKRPNNYVPDNIDESVDKAAEKIKETQPKTARRHGRSRRAYSRRKAQRNGCSCLVQPHS